jgi:uncharacterized protein YgiM (DUF1202 family)
MKKVRILCLALLVATAATAAAAQAQQMSVNVKETQLRSTPSYLGKVLGTLAYGDRVQVASVQNGWANVSAPDKGLTGYINESALTAKKVVLNSGSGDAQQQASSGEVALAGKGFNEQIESENRKDASYDYADVDRMEKIVVAPEAVDAFLKDGKLAAAGGSK